MSNTSTMTRPPLVLLRLLGVAALCAACSGKSHGGADWFGEPSSGAEEEPPFDPRALGASIICDFTGRSGVPRPFAFMLSALNHKLETYPDFAAVAGFDSVSECGGALRFVEAYGEYSVEHPGFDEDEPLGETPDEGEPAPPPDELDEVEQDTSKIAGANIAPNEYPVVQYTYQTCKPIGGRPSCPKADTSWIVNGNDLRNWHESCSGSFIAKNWILTAAHCMVLPAVDQCMQAGITRADCHPNWDLYASWRFQGNFSTGAGLDGVIPSPDDHFDEIDRSFTARGYIMKKNWTGGSVPFWVGEDILKAPGTCDTGCVNVGLIADHDLALINFHPKYDDRLPPRMEESATKRLSIVTPPANLAPWQPAIAGWGNPGDDVRRRGSNLGNVSVANSFRFDVNTTGAVYACPGDSGGPLMRTGLAMQTNAGARTNLDAIVGVMSASSERCDPVRPVGTPVLWLATRVDPPLHQQFIIETLKRWPNYKHFDGVPRKLGTPPPQGATDEVKEYWGKPCSGAGTECGANEFCNGPGRLIARRATPECIVCEDFAAPDNSACGCIQGQCLPL